MIYMGFANSVLEKLAEKSGDLEIFKQGDKVYTYNKLNNRANQIARVFLELGVERGDKYGILLYNSPEYVEIMFGLQKIQVIPVPVNVRYGSTEYKYIYENADIKGIFIDKDFVEITRELLKSYNFEGIRHIFVVNAPMDEKFDGMINYEHIIRDKETANLDIQVDDDDIGLLLYTGGTTGLPKGAMLTHFNLYNAAYLTPKHGMKLVILIGPENPFTHDLETVEGPSVQLFHPLIGDTVFVGIEIGEIPQEITAGVSDSPVGL